MSGEMIDLHAAQPERQDINFMRPVVGELVLIKCWMPLHVTPLHRMELVSRIYDVSSCLTLAS